MSQTVAELFQRLSGKPFIVQFVLSLWVEGKSDVVTEIKTFLISATSDEEARQIAEQLIQPLTDRYRNRDGDVVTALCEGIHSVTEVRPAHVDSDGSIELANVVFSADTRPADLVNKGPRRDLPLLD